MFGEITVLVVLAILFFVVANPMTYKVVDQILSSVGMGGQIFDVLTGQVSQFGVALHTVVFVALYCVYQKFVAPMMQGAAVGAPEKTQEATEGAEEEIEQFMEHQDDEDEDFTQPEEYDPTEEEVAAGDQSGGPPDHSAHQEEGGGQDVAPMTNPDEMQAFEGFESGGMGSSY